MKWSRFSKIKFESCQKYKITIAIHIDLVYYKVNQIIVISYREKARDWPFDPSATDIL